MNLIQFLATKLHQGPVFVDGEFKRGRSSLQDEFHEDRLKSVVVPETNILLFNFCEQKFVQHGPIKIAIDCNGVSLLNFEEKWPNYANGLKFAPDSFGCIGFSMYACWFSVPQMWQFCLFT